MSKGWSKIIHVAMVLSLALWLSMLVSAGVAAMFMFGTLPDLGVSLRDYSSYAPDNPDAHGRLAAGIVLERVFTAVDFAQVVLGAIVAILLLIKHTVGREPVRKPGHAVRSIVVTLALANLAHHVFLRAPVMNKELRAYWAAARDGDMPKAATHQAAFNTYHPKAELSLQANLFLVLIAMGATASSSRKPAASPKPTTPARTRPQSGLEPPALLKQP